MIGVSVFSSATIAIYFDSSLLQIIAFTVLLFYSSRFFRRKTLLMPAVGNKEFWDHLLQFLVLLLSMLKIGSKISQHQTTHIVYSVNPEKRLTCFFIKWSKEMWKESLAVGSMSSFSLCSLTWDFNKAWGEIPSVFGGRVMLCGRNLQLREQKRSQFNWPPTVKEKRSCTLPNQQQTSWKENQSPAVLPIQ